MLVLTQVPSPVGLPAAAAVTLVYPGTRSAVRCWTSAAGTTVADNPTTTDGAGALPSLFADPGLYKLIVGGLDPISVVVGTEPDFIALGITAAELASSAAPSAGGGSTPDATSGVKGKVQLAGDLGGTAAAPTVPGLAAKAADSAVVHNTGNETVAGVKTFSVSPVGPDPTTAQQLATRAYVLANAGVDATKVPLTQAAVTGTALPVFKVQPDVAARGPFGFTVGDSLFNSTRDFVGYWGYNAANGGQRYLNTEHSFAWVHESDYEVGAGTHWCESYTEYRNKTGGGAFRPWFLAIDKATDVIQEHSFTGAPFSFKDQSGGTLFDITTAGSLRAFGTAGQDPALEIHAAAGRTPQVIGYTGAVARFAFQGNADYLTTLLINGGLAASFQYNGGPKFFVGGDGTSVAVGTFKASAAGIGALAVAPFDSSQIYPIFGVWSNDFSAHYGGFNRNGYFHTKKAAAPSDGEIAAGELVLWFDPTNGAAKVMWKAKQADGTVRTGSVSLA